MEGKNWKQKFIEVLKERDGRFWLMLFVVTSTLSIFVIWSVNIKNVFSSSTTLSDDLNSLGIIDSGERVNSAISEFSSLLERVDEPKEDEKTPLSDDDLEKIIEAINAKIEIENSSTTASSSTIYDIDGALDNNSSSDLVLYPELDESDQTVKELKKIIEELEKKLGE